MTNRRGTQIWCSSDYYLESHTILKKMGMRQLSLISRHLESVGRTEPVFELNLAPSEQRRTYEFLSNSGIFYRLTMLTSQVATFVLGQRSKVT